MGKMEQWKDICENPVLSTGFSCNPLTTKKSISLKIKLETYIKGKSP